MKLSKKACGLAGGIIFGLLVFGVTNFLLLRGSQGQTISTLSNIYIGYSFSFLGSLVGMAWGFVDGFVLGWIFAFLYNLFAKEGK
jgi:hypothetical protein